MRVGRGGARSSSAAAEPLHDHHVAPAAVQPAVAPIDADLAKPEIRQEPAAWLVLDEDARDELPEGRILGRRDQGLHREAADPLPAGRAGDVHGELRDSGVRRARPVLERGGEADDGPARVDHDHDGVAAVEPGFDLGGRPGTRLEGRDPVLDALGVDAGDGGRVTPGRGSRGGGGQVGAHRRRSIDQGAGVAGRRSRRMSQRGSRSAWLAVSTTRRKPAASNMLVKPVYEKVASRRVPAGVRWIRLQPDGSVDPRVVNRRGQERFRDAAPAVPGPDAEADDRPHGKIVDLRNRPAPLEASHRAARPEAAPPDRDVADVRDDARRGLDAALVAERHPVRLAALDAGLPSADRLYSAAVCRHHWHQQARLITGSMSSKRSIVAGRTTIGSAPVELASLRITARSVWRTCSRRARGDQPRWLAGPRWAVPRHFPALLLEVAGDVEDERGSSAGSDLAHVGGATGCPSAREGDGHPVGPVVAEREVEGGGGRGCWSGPG